MEFLKKYKLRIALITLLLLAGFLAVYSVCSYKGSTSLVPDTQMRQGQFGGGRGVRGQAPQDQAPWMQGIPDPNGHGIPSDGQTQGMSVNEGTGLSPYLAAYAAAFLAILLLAYYFFINRKLKIDPKNTRALIFTLLAVGFLLRIFAAALMTGHPYDMNTFKNWAVSAANNLSRVYSGWNSSDYPPLYMYVLFLIGKAAAIPAVSPYMVLLLKLPSIIGDIASSFIIYRLAKKYLSLEMGVLLSSFYIFNPAVFINSTIWGQVDSLFTLLIIISIYFLTENKIYLSSAMFAAAVLMKPQGIIFLPVLFFELVRRKSLRDFLLSAVSAVSTAAVIILPFALYNGVLWIFNLFSKTVGEYPYASVNAFNFFSLMGKNYVKDSSTFILFSYHTWGMAFIVLVTAFAWFIYLRGRDRIFAFASGLILIAGVFTFSASMHERYLFPAAALCILAFIYLKDKRLLLLGIGLSATSFINAYVVLFDTIKGINSEPWGFALILTSLLNVVLFIYLGKVMLDIAVRKRVHVLT